MDEKNTENKDIRFRVRETKEELKKLKEAVKELGYKDLADWYRDMKRRTIKEAMLQANNKERKTE